MPRVKGGYTTRRRRKGILKLAKGYFGSKRTLYKTAHEQVMRSLAYAYRDRKQKKREFRKLWISRINAACKLNGYKYSLLVSGLNKAGITINRKMLADLAITDSKAFSEIIELAKKGNAGELVAQPVVKPAKKAETSKATKKVEEVKATKKAEEVKVSEDLSTKTVAELKELAKAKGISGISAMKKADLIEALTK